MATGPVDIYEVKRFQRDLLVAFWKQPIRSAYNFYYVNRLGSLLETSKNLIFYNMTDNIACRNIYAPKVRLN